MGVVEGTRKGGRVCGRGEVGRGGRKAGGGRAVSYSPVDRSRQNKRKQFTKLTVLFAHILLAEEIK